MCFGDAERLQHRERVVRELVERVRALRRVRLAVAARLVAQDAESILQRADGRIPHREIGGERVAHGDDGRVRGPLEHVVHGDAVDGDVHGEVLRARSLAPRSHEGNWTVGKVFPGISRAFCRTARPSRHTACRIAPAGETQGNVSARGRGVFRSVRFLHPAPPASSEEGIPWTSPHSTPPRSSHRSRARSSPTRTSRTRSATCAAWPRGSAGRIRSEEHTSELQSHSFISYAVFCLKKTNASPDAC